MMMHHRLLIDACHALLAHAASTLGSERAALMLAAPIAFVATTAPAAVYILDATGARCWYQARGATLPPAFGTALAAFLTAGCGRLPADAQAMIGRALAEERADLGGVVDLATECARGVLIPRRDQSQAVELFAQLGAPMAVH